MDNNATKIDFTFGWLALKLLGKSLYSNAWSAISELVANGFDANAKNVYVYINNTNKSDSTIELFDDGCGMDEESIQTYVRVGFNKRENPTTSSDYLPMGRKGIGKLAALYLSENYYLISKTEQSVSSWEMVYQENANDEEEHPFLRKIEANISIACNDIWNTCKTGTLIQMNHVNLSGLGDVAVEALSRKLSNYFSLDSMDERQIYLCVVSKQNDNKIQFTPVKKEIAFNNMAFINYSQDTRSVLTDTIENCSNNIIEFPYTKLNGNQNYRHSVEISTFNEIADIDISGTISCTNLSGNVVDKNYNLTGWIGLHSTIKENLAEKNDPLFSRNKFYNPIQLRLYVRNKLAMENFLTVLNNTQAFVNYIEGEIHFDILDEDDLPDIATSNRQGLDEHDIRVQHLVELVRKIVNNLINKRTDLSNKIKEKEKELLKQQEDNAKKRFVKEVENEVGSFSNLSSREKSELTTIVSNKIKGDVTPKNDYLVFISHSREDKIITDFIYYFLKFKGAKDNEFFYTSRDDNVDQYDNLESLADQIRKNILKNNVMLLYLTSNAYKKSEFCMFESGAGWATRGVGEYTVMSLTYPEIPKFITNGKLEFTFEKNKDILLDKETYLFLVKMFNKIIDHLNAGRCVNGEPKIDEIASIDFPSDLELFETGKTIFDFMDKDLVKHWDFYIENKKEDYLRKRYPQEKAENNSPNKELLTV